MTVPWVESLESAKNDTLRDLVMGHEILKDTHMGTFDL
jgi:hypothetical protein